MSKLIVMYPKPADPAHFAKHFREVHMPRSFSYGPATSPDGSDGAFFWVFVGEWESHAAITAALGSPEGQAAVADIPNYSTAAPTILYLDASDGAP